MTSSSKHWKVAVAAPSPSQSIPISGISRSQSELEDLVLLADYRDGQMYERILKGILRRSDGTGTYHPKTLTSLNNIIHTKMQDYESIFENRRSRHADEDWFIGDESEPIHSHPARELTVHKEGTPSLSSSESETLDDSISSLSCFSTMSISSDSESEADDSGIFELEL